MPRRFALNRCCCEPGEDPPDPGEPCAEQWGDDPFYFSVPDSSEIPDPIDFSHGGRFSTAPPYHGTCIIDADPPMAAGEVTYRAPWRYFFVNPCAVPSGGGNYNVAIAYPMGGAPMTVDYACSGAACGSNDDLLAGQSAGVGSVGTSLSLIQHGRGWWRTGRGVEFLWDVAPRQLCMLPPSDDWAVGLCSVDYDPSLGLDDIYGVCDDSYDQPVDRSPGQTNSFVGSYLFRGKTSHRFLEIELSAATGLDTADPAAAIQSYGWFGFRFRYADGSGDVVTAYLQFNHYDGLFACGPGVFDCVFWDFGAPGFSWFDTSARSFGSGSLKAILVFDGTSHELTEVLFYLDGAFIVSTPVAGSGIYLHDNCLYEVQLSVGHVTTTCGFNNQARGHTETNPFTGLPAVGSFDPAHAFAGDSLTLSNFRIYSHA